MSLFLKGVRRFKNDRLVKGVIPSLLDRRINADESTFDLAYDYPNAPYDRLHSWDVGCSQLELVCVVKTIISSNN